MKLSQQRKNTPSSTPSTHHVPTGGTLQTRLDSVELDSDALFLEHMRKSAGLQRKDFQYGLRVSATLVDEWFNGKKHHPLKRARDTVALFRATNGATWLIPTLLQYIAGDNFDGAVLSNEEAQALRVASKGVMK